MVKNFFDKIATRTRMGFFAAFFLLLISYILTFLSTRKVATQDFWMNHTNEVIHNLDNVSGFITKCESAFRGYLITGNKNLLATYDRNIRNTDSTIYQLRNLTRDNIVQQKSLDTLHYLIDQKFLWIENIISQYSKDNKTPPTLLSENDEGTIMTKNINEHIYKMKQTENNLWNDRSASVSRYSGLIQILNIVSIVIAVLLTFYSLIVYNKENKARRKASKEAEEYRTQLQRRVEQLGDLNTELIELRSLEKYSVTGRIARVIAHEVRNPLTNINLATEQIRSEMSQTQSDVRNTNVLFEMINRNSERINQLVSDLLDTTRVTELKFSQVSINDLLDASLELARDRIELNKIEVIKNYDLEICPISIDAGKIKIALLNIIVNAIEAIDEYGILKLSTQAKNNRCIVKITDNGKGMTKSELDRLFEPYFTTKEKGNGLGLANSQNIILAHDGSITAESSPGEGTTFTISFHIS
jgi:signal transduction histidine kinase